MLVTAFTAMVANLGKFSGQWTFDDSADTILFTVGAVLLVLAIWVVVEALLATRRTLASGTVNPSMSVFPEPSDDA